MNIRRLPSAEPADARPRHVIAEYKHRTQTVTCECGWRGSTQVTLNGKSAWQSHVALGRTADR